VSWTPLIPLLPAVAFALMWPMTRAARNRFQWLPLAAMTGSLGLSVAAFARVAGAVAGAHAGGHAGGQGEAAAVWSAAVEIARIGGKPLAVGLRLDPVSVIMLLVITVVGVCVQIYSLGYMHRDERRGWYFAVLSLFSAAMLALVLAGDFLLLYMTWEVMGLCSYLLIGFWHEQEGPRLASIKAFLTTRVGDVAFAIGLAVMYATKGSFAFATVLNSGNAWPVGAATAVALLFLVGAMGKSAQVPLHVWLPDAMAGPTPASALIHAATMVAAGVYLVARALPIFHAAAPWTLTVVLVVGTVTAVVGGLLATVQYDIKKILAYSTISQLGFMFIALGAGSEIAALFHLMTHAFFKSLLFLGAGVIIHAAHTQDIREMGGLRKSLPWTTAAFTAGALALSGVFPFSGFWSKDEILTVLWHGGHYVAFAFALLAALLTAFYMTRLWFRVFGDTQACSLAHEGHTEMVAPMVFLGLVTAAIGFTSPAFAGFLGEAKGWPDIAMALGSTAVALSGIGIGWLVYGRGLVDTAAFRRRLGYAYEALENKLYFDLTYSYFIVNPYRRVAGMLSRFDARVVDGAVNGVAAAWSRTADAGSVFDTRVIDHAVDGAGSFVRAAGARLRRLQDGRVQSYQRFAFTALIALLVLPLLYTVVAILLKGV